ncbi:tyrosine-type recombinase/integrase [Aliarcobacter butzleri]|uniref:tyrosine-type recombinase/integrase n=1 Tax=Aliarcobacter butzleri TaxID=28197 RepID=UPI001EDEDA33|nr:tyrosine-type recombinase/integrase [Aliarcobacter butzleri]MCG3694907.1 site-specific integrase [Aliarcobacter butzleri]
MKLGDYQYIFEYDNIEDLKEQLEITKTTHEEILKKEREYREVNVAINQSKLRKNDITFSILELKFLNKLKEIEEETNRKTSKESLKAYSTTFRKLINFFKDTNINNLSKNDFKSFRTHLKNQKLNPKTINNNIIYLNKFLNFAKDENLIEENYAKMESMLETTKVKENFTNEDYQNIFNYKFDKYYQDIFKILANTGMRISELYNIQKEDIINIDNVYCFNITKSKTENGIRQIPIHESILNLVLKLDFPISKKSTNAFNKEVLKELYKVIDKKSTKSIHTFRANFIEKLINNFPKSVEVVQEICGHSQSDDKKLTIKIYGKGFNIKLKNEMINSVNFLEI